jgi:hypothetical protein
MARTISVEESEDPELLVGTDSTGSRGLEVLLFMVGGLYVWYLGTCKGK